LFVSAGVVVSCIDVLAIRHSHIHSSSGLTMREVPCGCQPSADKIIQFLAAAEEGSYMHCMGNVNGGDLVNQTSFPEMDYELGAPGGPAAEVPAPGSGVWRRTFATGAWVLWDNTRRNGTYYFPGQGPPPEKAHPLRL